MRGSPMKKNDQRQLEDNFIERRIAEAFGYTEDQLADQLDRFMEEAEKNGQNLPKAPADEFQEIWKKAEQESSGRYKRKGAKRLAKVMVAVAVLGTMVLGGSMWVGARKTREYEVNRRSDIENAIVFNNNQDNQIISAEFEVEKAYKQIKQELEMQVMELSYLPEEISFHRLVIKEEKSILSFFYEKHALLFYQGINDNTSSLSYVSDTEVFKSVYNSFIDRNIPIYKQELENGNIEFSVRIVEDNCFYILEGAIEEKEFDQIVCGLKFYNN